MSSIRSTLSVLNNGIQSFVKGSGTILGGATNRLASYLEAENEIHDQNVVIDIDQRVKARVAEYYEFEMMLDEKHGEKGIARINELQTSFATKAQQRKEAK